MTELDPKERYPDGKFKPGVCGNPSGRPSRKNFLKLKRKLFSDEFILFTMFCEVNGIPTNLSYSSDLTKLIQHPDVKTIFRKHLNKIKKKTTRDARVGFSSLTSKDRIEVLKWLVEMDIGKATQHNIEEITTPEQTKISVEFVESKDED